MKPELKEREMFINGLKYELVSLQDLCTPKDNHIVYMGRYWQVVDGCALFFTNYGCYSPQCNSKKSITDRLKCKEAETVYVPIAYINQRVLR